MKRALRNFSLVATLLILLAAAPHTLYATTVVIMVDSNCSLANAIRSANGDAQVAESGDTDGNDDCEDGTEPDATADPPETGKDIIRFSAAITLSELLPAITSAVDIDGNNHSVSGDDKYPIFQVSGGALSIEDLTIQKGLITTFGGGIYVNGGSLSLEDSKVKDNVAGDIGGGIYASNSDVEITDSEVSGNSTTKSHGGGMYFVSTTGAHTLTIDGSTFKGNSSTEDGGGLKIAGGIVAIKKSTFANNTADEGGAIESSEATLDMLNSTISSNTAREGGGLSSFGSHVTLTHTTWAYNAAVEQGGGIAIIGWVGSFKIRNTLITDSASGGDCHSGPNPDIIIEFKGNFIQDGSCRPAPDDGATTQAAEGDGEEGATANLEAQHAPQDDEVTSQGDPSIAALQGSPPHHPLKWGSPAIDGGDPAYCGASESDSDDAVGDDQIDTRRPQYDNCDIGAYEYPKPPPATPTPSGSSSDDDDDDPTPTPPGPLPTATPTPLPQVCIAHERITVISPHDDMDCSQIDLISLDKHPALQGARLAMRMWRSNRACTHVVADQDNLYRLALRFNTTVETLRRHNNLGSNQVVVGQLLMLPDCSAEDGAFDPSTEVCFENQGKLVFIDTAKSERPVYDLVSYASGGKTCGQVSRPGIIVLVAQEAA